MTKITRDQIELLIELQDKEADAARAQTGLDELPIKIEQIVSGLKEFEDAIRKVTSKIISKGHSKGILEGI